MKLHVIYKQNLSKEVGADAARRWTDKIETDDPTTSIAKIMEVVDRLDEVEIVHILVTV